MHISPLPVPLQQLGGRRFSFYPPIRNLDHNEWLYRRATWSEVVIVNTSTGEEVCVPRAVIGDVSITDHPIVIVGLKRELEWKEGAICTHRRPVIELPVAVNQSGFVVPPHPERLAPVVSIRLESHRKLYTGRKIGVGLMLGAVACWVAVNVERQSQVHQRADALLLSRSYLQLSPGDDYGTVVRKLGKPAMDQRVSGPHIDKQWDERLRVLSYPRRQFAVVLAGTAAGDFRYIGAVDPLGRVLNAPTLPDGSSAASVLHALPRF